MAEGLPMYREDAYTAQHSKPYQGKDMQRNPDRVNGTPQPTNLKGSAIDLDNYKEEKMGDKGTWDETIDINITLSHMTYRHPSLVKP